MLTEDEKEIVENILSNSSSLKNAYETSKEEVIALSGNLVTLQKQQMRFPFDEALKERTIRAEVALQTCKYKKRVLGLALTDEHSD